MAAVSICCSSVRGGLIRASWRKLKRYKRPLLLGVASSPAVYRIKHKTGCCNIVSHNLWKVTTRKFNCHTSNVQEYSPLHYFNTKLFVFFPHLVLQFQIILQTKKVISYAERPGNSVWDHLLMLRFCLVLLYSLPFWPCVWVGVCVDLTPLFSWYVPQTRMLWHGETGHHSTESVLCSVSNTCRLRVLDFHAMSCCSALLHSWCHWWSKFSSARNPTTLQVIKPVHQLINPLILYLPRAS